MPSAAPVTAVADCVVKYTLPTFAAETTAVASKAVYVNVVASTTVIVADPLNCAALVGTFIVTESPVLNPCGAEVIIVAIPAVDEAVAVAKPYAQALIFPLTFTIFVPIARVPVIFN